MPGQDMPNFAGQHCCYFIFVFDNVQKSRPDKNIVSMNCADIGKVRVLKKINFPGEMIDLCSLYEVIKYVHQLIIALGISVQLVVIT